MLREAPIGMEALETWGNASAESGGGSVNAGSQLPQALESQSRTTGSLGLGEM